MQMIVQLKNAAFAQKHLVIDFTQHLHRQTYVTNTHNPSLLVETLVHSSDSGEYIFSRRALHLLTA